MLLCVFADGAGWFNFEFEKVSFWGRSRNVHALTYSPLVDQGRQDASSAESCSFDRFAPSLDRLIMCVIILAGVAVIRLGLVCVLTCGLKKEVPACMQFGSWEGPVMLVEYIAICSSSLLAASTLCSKWMAFGYVLLVFWPVGFLVVSAAVTGLRVQKEQIVYESYDAEAAPPKLPPRFTEVWKSLDGTKGIIPNTLIMREWFLAIEVRGWWKDVRISTSGFRFLVGDYVGHAYFFGSWVLVKKILLLSATTAINGRGSAIMCIIVQTFDMFFVVGLRPYVSKITCVSECIAAVTNWLAFLNLGLLLWPDSIPLQLGETTVFVLAILGTAIATLAAIVEALMAAFMVLFGVCASLAACMGISGSCMVTARAKLQQCCFGSLPKASVEGEDGPIFLTSIACDWAESQQQASDVSQNMAWAPIPFPYDPNYPNVSPQDPAVLAAYYRQLADYHQMISYNMKANSTGRATSNPAGMISPVSMSTAPTPFYNADTIQKQAAPATEVRVFDPMGMRASAYSQSAEPLLPLVSASLYRPGGNPQPEQVWHSSMPRMSASPDQNYDTNMFSRRAGDDGGDGAHMSSMPPALQSLTQRLASISPLSSPRSPRSESYWRPKEEAPRSVNSFGLGEHSISPSKSPPTRNLPQLSPKNDRRGNQNGYSTATARFPQSPRRQLPDHDSPRNLQNSNTKRADELGDGITRRAEVLRNALSPSSPLASLSPSLASNAPVYASGMMGGPVAQLSPSRNRLDSNDAYYPPKGSPMRGVVVPSSIRSSPMGVGSPMSQAYTPAAITSDNPESLRQDLMSRLENDTSTLRQRFLATSPHVVPPAPSYPAPPPPGQAPQYGPDADSEWDTGFG